ncbi:hypothetical protein HK405_002325 [Cladochytrium tenue]|nr:hypothetical protein HK405_002325 [Cladochytrium tenue]
MPDSDQVTRAEAGTVAGIAADTNAVAALRARAGHKSHSARALAFKAISYQKRQGFTNICCIGLCPLFFVVISAALGRVIQNLLLNSQTVESVYWFGEEYPQFSTIYERNANASLATKMDSTYTPPPDNGWISVLEAETDTNEIQEFLDFQLSPFAITGARTAELAEIFGARPKSTYNALQYAALVGSNSSLSALAFPNYTSDLTAASYGILGSIGQRLYANISSTSSNYSQALQAFISTPYFVVDSAATTQDVLDDDIDGYLQTFINQLTTLNKTVLQMSDPSSAELTQFYSSAGVFTSQMPYGSIFLDSAGTRNLSATVILSVGTDKRLEASSNFPTKGQRLFTFINLLSQGLVKYWGADVASISRLYNATITQGVRAFPDTQSTAVTIEFGGVIGRILYPFGVSFLLPIFVIVLVKGAR